MKKYLAKLYILISFALVFSLISCNNIFQQIKTDDTKTENNINNTPASQNNKLAYISLGSVIVGKQTARSSVVPSSNADLLSKLTNVNLACVRKGDGTPVNISGNNWSDFLCSVFLIKTTHKLATKNIAIVTTVTVIKVILVLSDFI